MKVAICTLGCKVNIYESEHVISLLKENNYELVDFNDYADIYIINTCTVTNTSDNKSRKMINHAKKLNGNAIIIVMGCHSQINADIVDADIVLGNKDKSNVIELINEYLKTHEKIKRVYDLKHQDFESYSVKEFTRHTRAFVKIQDGCDAYCSYCIIPYARGNVRSKKINDVISEVEYLVNMGYKEVVLVGIHTGKYGKDINTNLDTLLGNLIKIKGLYRLRISSIEINEISDKLIKMMKESNIIARHLHIPLQSGCDKILKLMNRKYLTNDFKEKINKIIFELGNISITTDVIVGFPNETDDDFNETYNFTKDMKFSKIHVFPYSIRKCTPAATMDNQVSEIIKKQRVKSLMQLSEYLESIYNKSFINREVEIIIDTIKDNKTYGYTSNYIEVMTKNVYKKNTIVKGTITNYNGAVALLDNEKSD